MKICLAVAIVSPLLSGVITYLSIVAANEPLRGFAIDAADNFIVGPLRDINQTTAFDAISRLSTRALLSRNPRGFDDPDLIETLFYQNAKTKADADLKMQLPNLSARAMHQKVEVSQMQSIAAQGRSRSVRIDGQLIRAGSVAGYAVNEAEPFALIVAIAPNPRLGERGQYPYVVFDYKLAVGKERVAKIMERSANE